MNRIMEAYAEFKTFYYMNEDAQIVTDFEAIHNDFINVIDKRNARKDKKQSIKFTKIK